MANYNNRYRVEQRRRELIRLLGGRCVHCGEDTYELLTIDHVNNDGYKDRGLRLDQRNDELLKFLQAGNKSKKFQVLCYNCNCSKGVWNAPMTPIRHNPHPWEYL